MSHDFADISFPDLIGKMQGEKLAGATGLFSELTGQQRRGVGSENGFFRSKFGQVPVKTFLDLNIFRNRLADQVGIPDRFGQIGGIAQAGDGLFDLRIAGTTGCLEQFSKLAVKVFSRLNAFFKRIINADFAAVEGGLPGDLRAEGSRSGDSNFFDLHCLILLSDFM